MTPVLILVLVLVLVLGLELVLGLGLVDLGAVAALLQHPLRCHTSFQMTRFFMQFAGDEKTWVLSGFYV